MSATPFRSHLLQQWVRTSQSRPPMVVVPWLKPHHQDKDEDEHSQDHSGRRPSTLSSVDSASYPSSSSSSSPHSSWKTRHSHNHNHSHNHSSRSGISRRLSSTSVHSSPVSASSTRNDEDNDDEHKDLEETSEEDDVSALALSFQSLLETRYTASKLTLSGTTPRESDLLEAALTRAVQCARMAPNHKRTEPWSMRRLMAPSPATEQLAEIAYQVAYNKHKSHVSAESKKSKWLKIPAFLVTLVHANQNEAVQDATGTTCSQYDALPFVAPQTERQLEDYAAACAAVQNCLLSLHAEDIGSKWATGPVIHTPAFRKLIGAEPTDRVVALVMVGGLKSASSNEATSSSRRRRRRSLDDILQDVDAS